jgi:hypothetical protein
MRCYPVDGKLNDTAVLKNIWDSQYHTDLNLPLDASLQIAFSIRCSKD